MVLTMVTVPLMLFPKPIMLIMRHKAHQENHSQGGGHNSNGDEESHGPAKKVCDEHEEEGHNAGEIFIHQIIETIEYVLGTVSHTASYLRLWALSLAHQQLSLVFFQKTILAAMGFSFPANIIAIAIMFMVWLVITLGILLGMDV